MKIRFKTNAKFCFRPERAQLLRAGQAAEYIVRAETAASTALLDPFRTIYQAVPICVTPSSSAGRSLRTRENLQADRFVVSHEL